MHRSDFLLSFVLSRTVLALAEIFFFALFARLLFDVRVFGSLFLFVGVGLLGTLCFGAIALLVGCRASNSETAGGLANLVILPMSLLSGVFFSVNHFPAWMQSFIQALPLTALNNALRAVMTNGQGLRAVLKELLILAGWGGVSFAFALRLFRWT
jgi:ABC-type multidrug transport system permease subunit